MRNGSFNKFIDKSKRDRSHSSTPLVVTLGRTSSRLPPKSDKSIKLKSSQVWNNKGGPPDKQNMHPNYRPLSTTNSHKKTRADSFSKCNGMFIYIRISDYLEPSMYHKAEFNDSKSKKFNLPSFNEIMNSIDSRSSMSKLTKPTQAYSLINKSCNNRKVTSRRCPNRLISSRNQPRSTKNINKRVKISEGKLLIQKSTASTDSVSLLSLFIVKLSILGIFIIIWNS